MSKSFLHNNISNKSARKNVLNRNIYLSGNMLKMMQVKLKSKGNWKKLLVTVYEKGGCHTLKIKSISDKKNEKI